MGTRKHPWTTSHPGLPWFGADRPPESEQAVFLHGAPEQGGAALLLCVLKQLLSLRWMMMAVVLLSFLSLMVHTLYILGYSLAKSAAKLARSYSVRLAARAHEPLSAPLERLSLIHVLPLRQDLIIKALVLFFMPFLFYSILYICVNAIWHEPPAMMTVSGRCDGSNMSVHLDSNLDLSSRIQGAGDYDADTNGKDLEFWQQVLASALEEAAETTTQIGGLKPTKGTLLYVRELEVPYEVRLLLPLHAAAPAPLCCCCRSLALCHFSLTFALVISQMEPQKAPGKRTGVPDYIKGTSGELQHTSVCMLCVIRSLEKLAQDQSWDPDSPTAPQKKQIEVAFKAALRGATWPRNDAAKLDIPNANKHLGTHAKDTSACAKEYLEMIVQDKEAAQKKGKGRGVGSKDLFKMPRGIKSSGTAFTQEERDLVDLAFVRLVVESPTTFPLSLGQLVQMQELFDALSRRPPGEVKPPKAFKVAAVTKKVSTVISPGNAFTPGLALAKAVRRVCEVMSRSGKSAKELAKVQHNYSLPVLSMQRDGETRVASVHKMYLRALTNYPALVAVRSTIAGDLRSALWEHDDEKWLQMAHAEAILGMTTKISYLVQT